jgi:hypothetical protein
MDASIGIEATRGKSADGGSGYRSEAPGLGFAEHLQRLPKSIPLDSC